MPGLGVEYADSQASVLRFSSRIDQSAEPSALVIVPLRCIGSVVSPPLDEPLRRTPAARRFGVPIDRLVDPDCAASDLAGRRVAAADGAAHAPPGKKYGCRR